MQATTTINGHTAGGPAVRSGTLLAFALCLLLAGCQNVAGLAAAATGDAPVPARYTPRKTMTLILAEHSASSTADDAAAEDIGRRVADQWRVHNLSPTVAPGVLEAVRSRNRDAYHSMSIGAIGRATGAAQVLYIDVTDHRIQTAGVNDMIRGEAAVRVRMIDTATGQTLWPIDAANGYPVEEESAYVASGDSINESSVLEETRSTIADDVVRLFYTFKSDH